MLNALLKRLATNDKVSFEFTLEDSGDYRALVQFHGAHVSAEKEIPEDIQNLRRMIAVPMVIRGRTPDALESEIAERLGNFAQANRELARSVDDLLESLVASGKDAKARAVATQTGETGETGTVSVTDAPKKAQAAPSTNLFE